MTPDGKKYEKRYYSDRSGGGERDRPTTSGFAPSLREKHTGFSPVRQVRPSTAGPASNRENLAMYLERMERILAEVQATHTDLLSRRNKRRNSRGSDVEERTTSSGQSSEPPEVETVPLDIDEILADASIEESPVKSPPRRLRDVLEARGRTPPRARLKSIQAARARTAAAKLEKTGNDNARAAAERRPSTAAKRTSALKKLRRVSARKRSVRQSNSQENTKGVQTGAGSDKGSPEGVIAVTSSTFCLNPDASAHALDQFGSNSKGIGSPMGSLGDTAADVSRMLLSESSVDDLKKEEDSLAMRAAVLGKLREMDAKTKAALLANLRRVLVRRRLQSKMGRSIVADIKHLIELIDGFGDETSASTLQNRQLELKMRNQFARDLSAKKRELLALLTTSRSLAPRVLKKPAVPVTPLKRLSKSLRIRNRPGTAPAPAASAGTGGGMIANKAVDVGRGTKIAWDEKENKKNGETARDQSGRESHNTGSRRGSKGSDTTGDESADADRGVEASDRDKPPTRMSFLKRKRAKVKMYKIPNYSHVKSVVDSHHVDYENDDISEAYFGADARPSTAPAASERDRTPAGGPRSSMVRNDFPIDDLKEILGLPSQGKETPASALGLPPTRCR